MLKKNKKEVLDFFQKDGVKLTIVSGIVTTKPNLIKWVDQNIPEIGIITSKSYQIEPTEGNREPIIVEQSVGNFGNAVGLRNPGMEQGYRDLRKLKEHGLKAILNVSLAAKKAEDFIILIKKFEDIADIFELNFSCPHAESGFGSSIGSNKEIVKDYLQKIRKVTNSLLFPKLTPNVENIGEIAQVCIDQGADGIVAINTVGPELYIEPHTKKAILFNPQGHQGGKSGDWIKEIALEKIKEIREAIGSEIPIIGMGGVSCASDVIKMQNAGANVVGIGSVLARVKMEDRKRFFRLLKEDVENGSDKAANLLNKERLAQYKPYKITKIIDKTETLR
ncbi:MAG TPA: dihydroorotate dehydrogenase, partial [Candidatus Woesebacteria bacterium]|nr:dihydroorotate dehydrogenase [Candidatus Woesebacteria bacterium]